MCKPEYIYKTVTVSHVLDASTFTKNINIDFVPDEVIVTNLNYSNDGTEAGAYSVSSDMVNGEVLGILIDDSTSHNTAKLRISQPVKGLYTFTIRGADGAVVADRAGDLFIMMEFRKYLT